MKKIRAPLWLIAVCLFMVWAVFGYKYQFAYNKGRSMEPTYSNGDWIVIEKRNHLPEDWVPDRYDVVLIKETTDNLCKRVIGLSGDTIEIKEGVIFLNGKKLEDPFGDGRISVYLTDENDKDLYYWGTKDKVVEYISQGPETVPEGHVWVIGDNREGSWYGILLIKNIKGLIIL